MRIVLSNLIGGAIGAVLLIASVQAAPPDNTAQNAQPSATAEDQKNDKTDLDLTASIRRAVIEDKTLSIYAHNVKIIAKDGFVTLRGPVKSNAERDKVGEKAKELAGGDYVKNEISVSR